MRDGRVAFWLDGELIADFPNLRLRGTTALKIDRFTIDLHVHSNNVALARKWFKRRRGGDFLYRPHGHQNPAAVANRVPDCQVVHPIYPLGATTRPIDNRTGADRHENVRKRRSQKFSLSPILLSIFDQWLPPASGLRSSAQRRGHRQKDGSGSTREREKERSQKFSLSPILLSIFDQWLPPASGLRSSGATTRPIDNRTGADRHEN